MRSGSGCPAGGSPAPPASSSASEALELGPLSAATIVLAAVVILPASEEVIFRRLLLDGLRAHLPTAAAAVLVIIAFAAVHVHPAAILCIALLGTALTFTRLWFDSLWAPLILHAINNALVTAVVLVAMIAG